MTLSSKTAVLEHAIFHISRALETAVLHISHEKYANFYDFLFQNIRNKISQKHIRRDLLHTHRLSNSTFHGMQNLSKYLQLFVIQGLKKGQILAFIDALNERNSYEKCHIDSNSCNRNKKTQHFIRKKIYSTQKVVSLWRY